MPECRWYYELFRNHKQGYQAVVKYLEIAYSSMKCDQKTIDLLFDSYLDILGWGAHHFPDGCIIEDNTIVDCFQKCEDILKEKTVSERLIKYCSPPASLKATKMNFMEQTNRKL